MYRNGSSGDQSWQSSIGMRTSTRRRRRLATLTGSVVKRPTTRPDLGFADDERDSRLCRRTVVAHRGLHANAIRVAMSGAVCTCVKWGVPRQDQLDRIEDAGDIALLLEIESRRHGGPDGVAVRADTDEQFVLAGS